MRVALFFGAVAAAAVVLPTPAHAGPRVRYDMAFTTRDRAASSGVDVRLLVVRPGAPDAKPVPVRRERFTFPAGTRFDGAVVPPCEASDAVLTVEGPSACAPSWVGAGYGDTIMTGFPGQGETPLQVAALLDGAEVKIVSRPEGFRTWFVAHGFTRGRVTTIAIPPAPGGPPDGQSALRRVHHVFPARSHGRHVFTRTPKRCPRSGFWTFRAEFEFADGVVERDRHRMRCGRRRPSRATAARRRGSSPPAWPPPGT